MLLLLLSVHHLSPLCLQEKSEVGSERAIRKSFLLVLIVLLRAAPEVESWPSPLRGETNSLLIQAAEDSRKDVPTSHGTVVHANEGLSLNKS